MRYYKVALIVGVEPEGFTTSTQEGADLDQLICESVLQAAGLELIHERSEALPELTEEERGALVRKCEIMRADPVLRSRDLARLQAMALVSGRLGTSVEETDSVVELLFERERRKTQTQ